MRYRFNCCMILVINSETAETTTPEYQCYHGRNPLSVDMTNVLFSQGCLHVRARLLTSTVPQHPSCHPLCCEFLAGRPSGSLSGSQQLASQMYQKGQLLSDVVTHFGIDYYNSTLQIRYDVRKSSTKQPTGFAETNFQITA